MLFHLIVNVFISVLPCHSVNQYSAVVVNVIYPCPTCNISETAVATLNIQHLDALSGAWQNNVRLFSSEHGLDDSNSIFSYASDRLLQLGYDISYNTPKLDTNEISSYSAVKRLMLSSLRLPYIPNDFLHRNDMKNTIYFTKFHQQHYLRTHNPIDDAELLFSHQSVSATSSLPLFFPSSIRKSKQLIVIYQNRHAQTGGTLALQIFYNKIISLGHNALLCNDTNFDSLQCTNPAG